MNQKRWAIGIFALLLVSPVLAEGKITIKSLLEEMVDRSQVAQLSSPTYTCKQFSSYNRDSIAPDKPGWFANADKDFYIRKETIDGRTEAVMMDTEGPGAIVRWWITMSGEHSGTGVIRVYLDGNEKPAIEGNSFDVISRGMLAASPLSENVSKQSDELRRGHNLYLPIPYAKSCKVTFERTGGEGAFYYQINYRTYEEGTAVETYSTAAVKNASDTLNMVLGKLKTSDRGTSDNWNTESFDGTLAPGASKSVSFTGAAALRKILVNIDAADYDQALRSTILKIEFDGTQTVWCPVGDFFGTGHQLIPHSAWYTEVMENGAMSCWWVMPFEKSAKVSLENIGTQEIQVKDVHVASDKWDWNENSLHFHSTWRHLHKYDTKGRNSKTNPTPYAEDINFVTVQGQGKYVGDTLVLYNAGTRWWGEGDEKIWVDGEDFPSHFGTGTEDYYGYAWCRPEAFIHPFIAQPTGRGNARSAPGPTVNSRWRTLDDIPFNTSIQFDMEIWHWEHAWMNYAPATFFYARPGAIVNIKPDPEQARITVPKKPGDVRPADAPPLAPKNGPKGKKGKKGKKQQ